MRSSQSKPSKFKLPKSKLLKSNVKISSLVFLILAALLVISLSGCRQGNPNDSTQPKASGNGTEQTNLVVFAASSLTESFNQIAKDFESSHPNIKVILNYAGTPTLQQQLENGATADVFASADETHMKTVSDEDLVKQPQDFATNKLVIITSKNSPVKNLEDLESKEYHLIVANAGVPVGGYTLEALDNLNNAYNPNYKAAVLKHVVSEETNVKQVVAKVQLGEADAGFVYSSDVTPAVRDQVNMISIPDQYNVTANYPVAAVKASAHQDLANEFIQYVQSASGQKILAGYGFSGLSK